MKKEVLKTWLCYIYPIVIVIIGGYLLFQEKDIVIKYPEIKTSKITLIPHYYVFQLPKHTIDVVSIYLDSLNNEHQIYSDNFDYTSDSLQFSIGATIDVDIEKKKAEFVWEEIKVKTYEKIKEIFIEVPKEIEVYKDEPFYRENWFWIWLWEKLIIISTIVLIGGV